MSHSFSFWTIWISESRFFHIFLIQSDNLRHRFSDINHLTSNLIFSVEFKYNQTVNQIRAGVRCQLDKIGISVEIFYFHCCSYRSLKKEVEIAVKNSRCLDVRNFVYTAVVKNFWRSYLLSHIVIPFDCINHTNFFCPSSCWLPKIAEFLLSMRAHYAFLGWAWNLFRHSCCRLQCFNFTYP